jgi:ubiquinone/menaquinone biosynthesis C-methylase UbiE
MPLLRDPEEIETKHLHDFASFAGARVLEIGTGEGRLTWRFADAARRVIGVDVDPARLAVARRERQPHLQTRVSFAFAKGESLPFPKEQFDLGILAWSL